LAGLQPVSAPSDACTVLFIKTYFLSSYPLFYKISKTNGVINYGSSGSGCSDAAVEPEPAEADHLTLVKKSACVAVSV
jgi:hypothetical protein